MKRLVIFIHGIGSDKSTWNDMIDVIKSDNQLKIEEYKSHLSTEENTTYYYLYEYQSKISNIPFLDLIKEYFGSNKSIGNITIEKHSSAFTTFLKDMSQKFDEINIVAHSMGGLITLFSLFALNKDNNYIKIKKIMFYGVPISGSEEPKKFKQLFGVSSKILKELQINSPTIKKIQRGIDDKKIKNKFQILYIDGNADARIYQIEQDYIKRNIGTYIVIQGGHSEIIRPKDIGDVPYTILKEFLFTRNSEDGNSEDGNSEDGNSEDGNSEDGNSEDEVSSKQTKTFDDFFINCKKKLEMANFVDKSKDKKNVQKNYYCDNILNETRAIKINDENKCDNSSIRVFINLFKQCFNLHTSVNIDGTIHKENFKQPSNVSSEHLFQDNDVSNLFIQDFYKYPSVKHYNYRIDKFEYINNTNDVKTRIIQDTIQNGSTIFITGFIGDGKSALLRKIEMDFYNEEKYKVLYIDIERFFSSDSDVKTVADSIFLDFLKKITNESINDNKDYGSKLKNHIVNNRDIKYILMIDSLDRIIYNDERYIFLKGNQNFRNKTNLIKEVVEKLIRFTDNLNASLVFALRPYIASTIFSKTQAINHNLRPHLCTLYEIDGNYSTETIKHRFNLLEFLLDHSKLSTTKEECVNYYIKKFKNILSKSDDTKNSNLFKAFYNSSTHGYRTMVELYQTMSEYPYLVSRFFKFDIVLYYKLAFKKMYSQILPDNNGMICQNRFDNHTGKNKFTYPNIFLIVADNRYNYNSSCNIKKNEFTFWLKYLILLLLQSNRNQNKIMTVEEIINIFNHNGYENFIIKLVLGSLGTSNEYNCLKYDFKGMNDNILSTATIEIANLGSYLINEHHCFKFADLQFIVDDWMLPDIKVSEEYFNEQQKEFLDDFLNKIITYEYLSDESDKELHEFIPTKTKKVLFFLYVLEVSFKYEQIKYESVFEKLKNELDNDTKEIFNTNFFRKRRNDVIRETKNIIMNIPTEKQEEINTEEFRDDFLKDIKDLNIVESLEKLFKDVYNSNIQVGCLEFM